MTTAIDITQEHLKLVQDILAKHLLPTAKVWVFGSRVTGRAKKFSDLDLAIETRELAWDFEDSDLPYKVDLVDWVSLDDAFKKIIAADRVPLR